MLENPGPRLSLLTLTHLSMVVLAGAVSVGACAQSTYQLPADAPPVVVADRPADRPDGGRPPLQPSSRRGVIVPGDPASGTTRLGTEGTEIETHTGTAGTRVNPGGSDGK